MSAALLGSLVIFCLISLSKHIGIVNTKSLWQ